MRTSPRTYWRNPENIPLVGTYISRYRGIVLYFLIGVPVFVTYYGLLVICTSLLGIHYLVSGSIAFCSGTLMNYMLNKKFNFKNKSTKITRQFSTFFAIALIGLVLNEIVLYSLVKGVRMHYTAAGIVGLILVAPISFLLHKKISFSKTHD